MKSTPTGMRKCLAFVFGLDVADVPKFKNERTFLFDVLNFCESVSNKTLLNVPETASFGVMGGPVVHLTIGVSESGKQRTVVASSGEVVFNPRGEDSKFKYPDDRLSHLFFVDLG